MSSESLAQLFAGERFLSLATFRRDGREVATPIWFAPHTDALGAYSERSAGKIKRLRNSGRSRVAACSFRGRVHGPWHDTQASLVDGEEAAAIARALRAKYGFQISIANVLSKLSGKHAHRQYLRIELAPT